MKTKSERLNMYSFRADAETERKLAELERALPPEIVTRQRRSLAIRRAIDVAWKQLTRLDRKTV